MSVSRVISLSGTRNFRDFGGCLTAYGNKRVKRGVLFRSDQLANVRQEDAAQVLVKELHIAHTFDLRSIGEVETAMYAFPGITRHSVPIHCGNVLQVMLKNLSTATYDQIKGWLQECYEVFVREFGGRVGEIVKEMIKLQLRPFQNAALFHCTAGKDRTGFVVYIILSLLGVEESVIMDDYLLTNTLILAYEPQFEFEKTPAAACNLVDENYLRLSMRLIKEGYGTVDKYAESEMGVTLEEIQELREMLLEEVQ